MQLNSDGTLSAFFKPGDQRYVITLNPPGSETPVSSVREAFPSTRIIWDPYNDVVFPKKVDRKLMEEIYRGLGETIAKASGHDEVPFLRDKLRVIMYAAPTRAPRK